MKLRIMESDAQQNLRDDQTSDCWSFGSNYHPSSQSRKISIGIMADSLAKKKSGGRKEDEVAVSNTERETSNRDDSREGKTNGQGVPTAIADKQTEAPEKGSSPWINTKSLCQKDSILETIPRSKQTSSLSATGGRQSTVKGIRDAQATHSVQFFANQTSVLQPGKASHKRFDGITYRRRGGEDGSAERVQEFKFSTAEEIFVLDKAVMDDTTNKPEIRKTESLRMKLWELLGTVSSPNKQCCDSQILELGANEMKPKQNFVKNDDIDVKPRQNSDTIETDSESPDHTVERRVTRSSTRRRAPAKLQLNKRKSGPSSSYKQKPQDTNIFSFEEGWSGRPSGAVNSGSSTSSGKKNKRKSSRTELHKMSFPEKENANKNQQAANGSEIVTPVEKSSSLVDRIGGLHGSLPQNNGENLKQKNKNQEKYTHQLAVPESRDQQDDFGNLSLKNAVEPQVDFQSPTFGLKSPITSASPCSQKTDHMEKGACSPAPAKRKLVGDICSFRTLQASKPDYYESDAQLDSSDDSGGLKDSPLRKTSPIILEEKDAEHSLSESLSEERDSEDADDDPRIMEGEDCDREREAFSPEIATAEEQKFILRPTKRLRSHEGIISNECTPTSASPKGTGESKWIPEPSEQNLEDGLARAIKLFALAVQKLKCKIKSVTSKKSSEILMSVAEEIHLQLQNIETKIQTDVGKLSNLSKSKRKRLETRLQEQQEQLKLIHEKFKVDVNQHFQEYRNTLERLEARQIELEETVESQKASHRKHLLQVEKAVENQLNDAQRRISAVHEVARDKILQLKLVIAECLKEGLLS